MTELAVAYARVSSREQEQGYSIPAQQKALHAYAAAKQITILREFLDVETAKESGRANFGTMLTYLRRHPSIRNLLVEKTDRLYRNVEDWVLCDQIAGLQIHFVKESSVLSRESRSHEKFFHGIKVLMAKNYVDNLSEEARKGMQEKASQGLWPSSAPIGYRNALSDSGRRVIEVDIERAPIISELFRHYATGCFSIRDLAEKARREGLVQRRTGRALAGSNIHLILRNPIYTGRIVWRGATYQGLHQPLVSPELFEKVQRILRARNQQKEGDGKARFAFAGLIRCGHCGCAMVGELKKGRYIYYHCTGFRGKCKEPYVREEKIAEQFVKLVSHIHLSEEITTWIQASVDSTRKCQLTASAETIERLRSAIDRIEGRIQALYIDKLEGQIDAATFDSVSSRSVREKDTLGVTLRSHEASMVAHEASRLELIRALPEAPALFGEQTAEQQRHLLNCLVAGVSWKEGKLTAKFRPPFCWFAGNLAR